MDESTLQAIPLFASLPVNELQQLNRSLHLAKYPAGLILFREGEPADRFTIIMEGQVEIIQAFETPEERLLTVVGTGDFLGEVSLLYPDRLRSATARTQTPVELLEMTSADFDALLNRQPSLAVRLLRELSIRLRKSETLTIRDLQEKNRQLTQAYLDLKAAQAQIIEKEKLEQELRLARKIQQSILPKELPSLPGWQIEAYWQPARAVSGDFYDFISFHDDKLGLVIGDVTDKGMPAALVMATTRSLLRFAALDAAAGQSISPGKILAKVNEILLPDIPANMFVTCLFAVLDYASGRIVFANAGHPLPCQSTPAGIIELRATGMPLGLLPGMDYEESEAILLEGDRLVMYSDGLIEAHNLHRELFGMPRLKAQLLAQASGTNLIDYLLGKLAEFTGPGWEQEDDITFVTLARSPPGSRT